MFYYTEKSKIALSSRFEAINHKESCKFFYYDDVFSKVDWDYEPKETLDELYRLKAQKIRQEFDYVILAYSGGADSSNILETFYYNNIHIDEILTVGAFSQDSYTGSDENHNKELYDSGFVILKKLELKNTKITQFDYTSLFNNIENFSLIKKYGSDWITHIGSFYSVHNLFWNDVFDYVGPKDKKRCVIFGIEKANYEYSANKNLFYTFFSDFHFTSYGNILSTDNCKKINFYSDPDAESINILRKQLHTIKHFFLENVINNKIDFRLWIKNRHEIEKKLLYNIKNKILFKSKKSVTNFLSVRDKFIMKNQNSDIYKIYIDGIQKIPNLEKKYPYPIHSFVSKNYYFK